MICEQTRETSREYTAFLDKLGKLINEYEDNTGDYVSVRVYDTLFEEDKYFWTGKWESEKN